MSDFTGASGPAPTAGLDALFAPRSIAIVGASNDERRFGGRPLQYLKLSGYAGPIYPINPGRTEVQGIRAYPTITAVGQPVDCAVISVAADEAVEAVRQCAAVGVRTAVLFSPGFAEIGAAGLPRQRAVLEAARAAGMRLLGPNCMGFFNARAGVYATFASALEEGPRPAGPIGLVSQSGGYGGYVLKHCLMRGLGIGLWATTGNECDVDMAELLLWLAGRDEAEILVAYMEGVRRGRTLVAALELARRKRKPVVVMKVGRTETGRVAARSHTDALTGEDEVYEAVFRQYGAYRARTTEELLDVTYALTKRRLPAGRRLGVLSISGGIGVQIADFASDAALEMPRLPDATGAALRELVPFCSPGNPIDMTGLPTADHHLMEKSVDLVLGSNSYDAVLVFLGITGAAPSMAVPLRDALAAAYSRHPDRLLVLCVTASGDLLRSYDAQGMFVFEDPARAITALAALAHFADSFAAAAEAAPPALAPPGVTLPPVRALNEAEAKQLLERCGVRVPRERRVDTPDEAAVAAAEIGLPVALKIVSRDILHKTDAGGVLLGLATAEAVRDGARRMAASVAAAVPGARLEGFLVSEMVPAGVECLVGVRRDAVFGPLLTVALGGTLVELYRDAARRLAPVTPAIARAMLEELVAYRLLTGYRGSGACDVDALVDCICRVSEFAARHAERVEVIEVNPVRVLPAGSGAIALDAVVELTDAGAPMQLQRRTAT